MITKTRQSAENRDALALEVIKVVERWSSSAGEESSLYEEIVSFFAGGQKRPNVSGPELSYLNKWYEENLVVSQDAVGELISDLYKDYVKFVKAEVSSQSLTGGSGETPGEESLGRGSTLSRKKFSPCFLYLVHRLKNKPYVELCEGRRGSITSVSLKKHKRTGGL